MEVTCTPKLYGIFLSLRLKGLNHTWKYASMFMGDDVMMYIIRYQFFREFASKPALSLSKGLPGLPYEILDNFPLRVGHGVIAKFALRFTQGKLRN